MDQANKNQPAPANATPLKPDIVSNIPLHQAAPSQKPVSEAEDIDAVMKDVGKQLKQEEKKPEKHHWFGHKPKDPSFSAKPVARETPVHPPAAAVQVQTTGPMPRQPAPKAAPPPPKSKSGVPIVAILFTLIITAFLIAAAIAAFKKSS